MSQEKRKEVISALKSTIELLYENASKDKTRSIVAENNGNIELALAYAQCSKQEVLMAQYLEVDLKHIESVKEELSNEATRC